MNTRDDRTSLSRDELLDVLRFQETELQTKETELQSQRQQLREQDIALQTKDEMIAQLEQQNQGWELAYNELVQRAFRHRSERYLENPDQLRLDFGDTVAAADAAAGLADAVEELELTVPATGVADREAARRKPAGERGAVRSDGRGAG